MTVINVTSRRVMVGRWIEDPATGYHYFQPARNWRRLEVDALHAVIGMEGFGVRIDAVYPCPDDLAAQAAWPKSEGRKK